MSENNTWDGVEQLSNENTEKKTDRKCPDCGGAMNYDPSTGGITCPYCGRQEQIEVKKGNEYDAVEERDFFDAVETESFQWGVEKKTVQCEACNAKLVYDALQNSEVCPYCGSNQVMKIEDEKTMCPGGVVPFEVTDKDAAEYFRSWIKGKWFCPSEAKKIAKAGKFNGVYLPYWTFDTETYSDYWGEYGIDRRVRVNKDETRIVTDWYNTSGTYDTFINDYPVLASTNHDQNMLKGILPFDTESNKAYEPEFVAGFASERYSIGLKEGWEIAKPGIINMLKGDVREIIRHDYDADHVRDVRLKTTFEDIKYKYLLLPVWNSSFKYNGKVYKFMVNGQTGKVAGKSPISPLRVAVAIIIGLILLFVVGNLIWEY